ncbi:MAG: hypothetical protein U0452_13585 [Anaerolineae bacterium]
MDTNVGRPVWSFDQPALYQICVQGKVPQMRRDLLDGMSVTVVQQHGGDPMAVLVGELADQVALEGVLRTLFEMHLTVLSVSRIRELS